MILVRVVEDCDSIGLYKVGGGYLIDPSNSMYFNDEVMYLLWLNTLNGSWRCKDACTECSFAKKCLIFTNAEQSYYTNFGRKLNRYLRKRIVRPSH